MVKSPKVSEKNNGMSIPHAAFVRVVRNTMIKGESGISRISPAAIVALQIFAEQSVGDHINRAAHIAETIGNTKTLMVKHFVASSGCANRPDVSIGLQQPTLTL